MKYLILIYIGLLLSVNPSLGALVFPATPTVGQVFVSGSTSWKWDGAVWGVISGSGASLPRTAVEAIKSDTFSTSSTNGTFVDVTGLSVTITPSTSGKKVRVEVFLSLSTSIDWAAVGFRVLRGATPIGVPAAAGARTSVNGSAIMAYGTFFMQSTSFALLDSPATTSATTYKVQITGLSGGAVTSYVNRSGGDADTNAYVRGISHIRVYEVD
jgi:hypothetical protein